MNNAELRH